MFRNDYQQGQEIQIKYLGLWEIGVFISEDGESRLKVKIGKQTVSVPYYDVKHNHPAYQKEEGYDKKGASHEAKSRKRLL